jgi:glycosyltransferase involved in cell wall biosynthesis
MLEKNNQNTTRKTVRVLQLIEHLRIGGAERIVCQLYQGAADSEVEQLVCVYSEKGSLGEQLEEKGGNIIFLAKNPRVLALTKQCRYLVSVLKIFENLLFVFKLANLFKEQKIDIVQCHLFSACLWCGLAAKLLGKNAPVILMTEHYIRSREKIWYYLLLHRYLLNRANQIVAVSPDVVEALAVFHPNIKTPITIIQNSVTLLHKNVVENIEQQLPQVHPRIAIVGRLSYRKRHDVLLKALQHCMLAGLKFCCLVIGDGEKRQQLEDSSRELGLDNHVVFMGQRQDIDELLPSIDIAVNVSDAEGLPVSVLEAMAAGLPVVATDVRGNRELVQHNKTGLLCQQGDAKAVAEALAVLINTPSFAKQLGVQAQAMIAENYNFKKIAQDWKNLYLQLVEG